MYRRIVELLGLGFELLNVAWPYQLHAIFPPYLAMLLAGDTHS